MIWSSPRPEKVATPSVTSRRLACACRASGPRSPTRRSSRASSNPACGCSRRSLDDYALLGVVGPTARLRGVAGVPARSALRGLAGDESAWGPSGPIERGELDTFLSEALVASLSYLSSDGYPASVPLWYDWDGSAFWLVPSPGAEWAEHVRRNPRISLAISESTPPLRRVLARGPALAVEDADARRWRSLEDSLAARYARLDAGRVLGSRPSAERVLLKLVPERLIAWRGLVRPTPGTSVPPALHEAPNARPTRATRSA